MTKNNSQTKEVVLGNINDFAPAGQQEVILGNINDFTPAKSKAIYDEETGQGIEIPSGMDEIETNYRINTDVKKIPAQKQIAATPIDDTNDSNFFLDVFNFTKRLANGDFLSQVGKGIESSIKSTPQLFGSYLKQIAGDINKTSRDTLSEKGFSELELAIDYPAETNKELDSIANQIITKNQQRLEAAGLTAPQNDSTGKFFFDLGSAAPNLVTALGVTAITKNPLPASALFAEIQKDQIYLEARQKGLNHQEAMATAIPAGLAEGGLELIGLDRFFKIGKGDKFISKVVKRSLVEAGQEATQQVVEDIITDVGNVRDTTKKEKFENAMYSGLLGLVLGAPAAVVTTSVEKKLSKEDGITKEEISKGIDELEKSGAPERMKNLLQKETDSFLDNPEVESKIIQDIKEATKEQVPTGEQNLAGVLSKIQESRRDSALTETTQATQDSLDSAVLEGRLKKLDDNISTIDKQIDAVTQLIENKQNNNQATARDEQKLNTLVSRRDLFDEERANILTTQSPRSTETLTLGDKTANIEVKSGALSLAEDANVTLKGSKLQNIGQTAIRDINKSFREGRALAKKDVTEAQNFITTVIDQSALIPTDKAKFIRTIKNIQDADALTKKLPEIQSRISNLVEAASRRQLKADIKAALSKTKTKKQSGKPVGKFGADAQKTLDRLRNASKLSVDDAKDILNTRNQISSELAKAGQLPTYEDALESAVLSSVADSQNTKVSDLQNLKSDIEQLIAEGKTSRQSAIIAKKAKVERIQTGISELISQGENLDLQKDPTFKNFFKESKGAQAWLNYAWGDIIDAILPPSKTDANLKTSIVQDLNITKEVQKEKGIQRKRRDAFIDAAKESFGFAKEGELHDQFLKDSKEKFLGVFTNAAGKQVRLDYSKAQARKFWMELQDPSLKNTIESAEGMAYTPEMISAITAQLDHKDISFAKAQLKLYEDFYPEINKVYSRVYGVDLPAIENYSPISRIVDKDLDSNVGEFMQETFVRLSIAPGSLKSRVNNLGELRKNSDVEVYQRHISEMAHFIAMQEKVQQIQQVFGDKDVRKNIEKVAGKLYLKLIDENIESFAKNGATKSNWLGDMINYLNRGFALSVLGGKLALTAKQATSTFAYWEGMSVKDFASGVIDFAKNPKKAIETLNESELVKARGVPEYDLAKIGKTNQFKTVATKNKFIDAMLLPVKFGDKGAILIGGWAYYKNQLKQGKTHEQALQAFEEFTAKTQQSTDLDQITSLQRSGAFGRTLTMFLTAPNAYYRAEVKAIRQFKRGEISGKDFGKKLFIYHILLPATFQFVANGFTFDEEDQLVAVATGPLNGFFILGDVINNLVREAFGGDSFQESGFKFLKFAQEIKDGMIEIATSGGDVEDVLEGVADISKGVGRVAGLPVDQAKNMAEGVDDFDSDRPLRGTLRFLGYPKKSVEEIDN